MNFEERIVELERRLAILEAKDSAPSEPYTKHSNKQDTTSDLISLVVTNKRFDPTNANLCVYEDHIWFDCSYTLQPESKPTRAVKGEIIFSDLFGEIKFKIQLTLNEPLTPGQILKQPGIGFTYNQFIGEHQWMLATRLEDMRFSFKATNVIYTDGAAETFI